MRNFIDAVSQIDTPIRESLDDLFEGVIPETPYGYWITDQGKFLVVAKEDHYGALKRAGMSNYGQCFDEGWIRIVCVNRDRPNSGLNVRFDDGRPTNRAMMALQRLAKTGFETFTVDIGGNQWIMKVFDAFGPFYSFVVKHRSTAVGLTEAALSIPETQYGYWISPEGEYIVVPYQGHRDTIRTYSENKLGNAWVAMNAGWIRIVATPRVFAVQITVGKPSIKAVSAVRKLINARDYQGYVLDANDEEDAIHKTFETGAPLYGYLTMLRRAKSVKQARELTESILDEGTVPETQYGYWIKPDGDILAVDFCSHAAVLHDSSELDGKRLDGYKEAFDHGWIRLVADKDLAIQFEEHKPSFRAMSALRRVSNSREFRTFVVATYNDKDQHSIGKNFDLVGAAMAYCMPLRATRNTRETSLTEDQQSIQIIDGGGWIDADGDVINCDHGEEIHHSDIAMNYFGTAEDEMDGDDDTDWDYESDVDNAQDAAEAALETAYEAGWIRVGAMGKAAYVDMGTPSRKALRTLKRIAKDFDENLNVYILKVGGHSQQYPDLRSLRVGIARLAG